MKKLLLILTILICPLPLLSYAPQTVIPAQQAEIQPYRNYGQICTLMARWARENPRAVVLPYGKSSRGYTLTSLHLKGNGPIVLIHGCIHGNEPLSTTVVLSYTSKLLTDDLGKDRDIYIIPVVCPDSYPNSRYCDGVDPNRNYNGNSIPAIAAVKELFNKIKPKAAWSGHTSGRMFVYPYGNSFARCPDDAKMLDLYNRMGRLSGYRVIRGCQMYSNPIFGSEIDWYYQQNRCVSVVTEYGKIQRIPTAQETKVEFERTWPAFLLWLKEAPRLLVTEPASY